MAHQRFTAVRRGWAIGRIHDWLASSEGALLVTGAAGAGKTALVSQLLSSQTLLRIRAHAVHYCRAHAVTSTDPIRILANIASQLSQQLSGYEALLTTFDSSREEKRGAASVVADSASTRKAFEYALLRPLDALPSARQPDGEVLVVLDGLDEGSPGSATAIDELLDAYREQAVPGLRLLLTARPGAAARQVQAQTLDLVADCPPDTDEIDEYLAVTTRLRRDERRMIAAAAEGSYLYAQLATRLGRDIARIKRMDLPDQGADGLYGLLLDRRLGADPLGRRVLSVLACSRDYGFTTRQTAALVGAAPAAVARIVDRCGDLLRSARHVRPHHRCLAEYVLDAWEDSDPAEPACMIATRLLDRWEGRWAGCREVYGLRNLLVHLADVSASGQPRRDAALDCIRRLIGDPQFLTTAVTRIGVDDLLSALRYAQRRLPARLDPLDDAVTVVHAQAAHLRPPHATSSATAAQQLVYEAATIGATNLGRALASEAGGAILTLWATADDPSRSPTAGHAGHSAPVVDIAITSTGEKGVTTAQDGTTKIWWLASGRLARDLATGAVVAGPLPGTGPLPEPGRSDVPMAHINETAGLWHIGSSRDVEEIGGRGAAVTAFAVSADSAMAVTGDVDGNATVWDLAVGEVSVRLPCGAPYITAVAISADGRIAAVSAPHGHVTLWDTPTGLPVYSFNAGVPVTALALTSDARRIIIGSYRSLVVHRVGGGAMGGMVAQLRVRHRITAVAVNPAINNYVLFGTVSGQVAYIGLPI